MSEPSEFRVTCTGCRRAYGIESWNELAAVETLRGSELGAIVVAWPTGRAVEVRVCQTCTRRISRLSPSFVRPIELPPCAVR